MRLVSLIIAYGWDVGREEWAAEIVTASEPINRGPHTIFIFSAISSDPRENDRTEGNNGKFRKDQFFYLNLFDTEVISLKLKGKYPSDPCSTAVSEFRNVVHFVQVYHTESLDDFGKIKLSLHG